MFVYLTNGSARNVWSSTLVESTMAVVAPGEFPHAVLSERLIGYALDDSTDAKPQMRSWLRDSNGVPNGELERAINSDGYAIRENLGAQGAEGVRAEHRAVSAVRQHVGQPGRVPRCIGEREAADRLYAKAKAGEALAINPAVEPSPCSADLRRDGRQPALRARAWARLYRNTAGAIRRRRVTRRCRPVNLRATFVVYSIPACRFRRTALTRRCCSWLFPSPWLPPPPPPAATTLDAVQVTAAADASARRP